MWFQFIIKTVKSVAKDRRGEVVTFTLTTFAVLSLIVSTIEAGATLHDWHKLSDQASSIRTMAAYYRDRAENSTNSYNAGVLRVRADELDLMANKVEREGVLLTIETTENLIKDYLIEKFGTSLAGRVGGQGRFLESGIQSVDKNFDKIFGSLISFDKMQFDYLARNEPTKTQQEYAQRINQTFSRGEELYRYLIADLINEAYNGPRDKNNLPTHEGLFLEASNRVRQQILTFPPRTLYSAEFNRAYSRYYTQEDEDLIRFLAENGITNPETGQVPEIILKPEECEDNLYVCLQQIDYIIHQPTKEKRQTECYDEFTNCCAQNIMEANTKTGKCQEPTLGNVADCKKEYDDCLAQGGFNPLAGLQGKNCQEVLTGCCANLSLDANLATGACLEPTGNGENQDLSGGSEANEGDFYYFPVTEDLVKIYLNENGEKVWQQERITSVIIAVYSDNQYRIAPDQLSAVDSTIQSCTSTSLDGLKGCLNAGKIGSSTCFSSFEQACATSQDRALCGSANLGNPVPSVDTANIISSEIITSGVCD